MNEVKKPIETQTSKLESNSSIQIIPSSLSGIDYNKLNKYLSKEDFKEKTDSIGKDFYDSKEYEKQQKEKEAKKEQIYGPSALPIVFQQSVNLKNNGNKKLIEEVIKIDSDSSSDNDFEFIEKKAGQSEQSSSDDSDEKTKKKKTKNKKKKSKKKSKKKK
jgi:hypothetical protein